MQNTGDPLARAEIVAIIEHVLSDRAGEWRVSIVWSHANDNWEMKVEGPEGFERSYTLVGSSGEHEPAAIGNLVVKLLPARKPSSAILVRILIRTMLTSEPCQE